MSEGVKCCEKTWSRIKKRGSTEVGCWLFYCIKCSKASWIRYIWAEIRKKSKRKSCSIWGKSILGRGSWYLDVEEYTWWVWGMVIRRPISCMVWMVKEVPDLSHGKGLWLLPWGRWEATGGFSAKKHSNLTSILTLAAELVDYIKETS